MYFFIWKLLYMVAPREVHKSFALSLIAKLRLTIHFINYHYKVEVAHPAPVQGQIQDCYILRGSGWGSAWSCPSCPGCWWTWICLSLFWWRSTGTSPCPICLSYHYHAVLGKTPKRLFGNFSQSRGGGGSDRKPIPKLNLVFGYFPGGVCIRR